MKSGIPAANVQPTFFDHVKRFAAPISQNIRDRMYAFMQATKDKPKPPQKPFFGTQYQFNTLHSDLRPIANKMVLLKVVFARLFKVPQVEKLVSTAFGGKSFTLSFVNRNELFSEGECNFAKNQINIHKNLSVSNTVSTLLYELCNANNSALKNVLVNQFNDEDDYALAIEKAEYLSYQNHISLLSTLINDHEFVSTLEGVGENIDVMRAEVNDAYQTFDEYWQGANKANDNGGISHCEYYRKYYRNLKSADPVEVQVQVPEPVTPGFSTFKATPSCTIDDKLAVHFKSHEAKELLAEIGKNQQAIAMLKRIPSPIAACLAKNTTKRNLEGFKALNKAEQSAFISQYIQCKMKHYTSNVQSPKPSA